MKTIVFDFAGKHLELSESDNLIRLIAAGDTKFSFDGKEYTVIEKTVVGLKQQAVLDAKRAVFDKKYNEISEKRHQLRRMPNSFRDQKIKDQISNLEQELDNLKEVFDAEYPVKDVLELHVKLKKL